MLQKHQAPEQLRECLSLMLPQKSFLKLKVTIDSGSQAEDGSQTRTHEIIFTALEP